MRFGVSFRFALLLLAPMLAVAAAKPLSLEDYGRWNSIGSVALSPDGKWITYGYRSNAGEMTPLYVKSLDGGRPYEFAEGAIEVTGGFIIDPRFYGSFTPVTAGGPVFSEDSRWLAFKLRSGEVALLDLRSGRNTALPGIASFEFTRDSRWLVITLATGELRLRDLRAGQQRTMGPVSQSLLSGDQRWLACATPSGLALFDLRAAETISLDAGPFSYSQLSFSQDSSKFAVLRSKAAPAGETSTLIYWEGVGNSNVTRSEWQPEAGARIAAAPISWSNDGQRLVLSLAEPEAPAVHAPADLEIWHWEMERLPSEQLAFGSAPNATGILNLAAGKFQPIGDAQSYPGISADARWATLSDDRPYRDEPGQYLFRYVDIYYTDTATGVRQRIEQRTRTGWSSLSPDSTWLVHAPGGRPTAIHLATGKRLELGEPMDGRFTVGDDAMFPGDEKNLRELPLWTADGKAIVLAGKYDLWKLPLDGSRALNLTRGVGRARQIVFRVGSQSAGRAIDLTQPLTLYAFGDRSKKSGYWRLAPGSAPTPLLWKDELISGFYKAPHADRVLFTRQTFTRYPDLWIADASLRNPRRITEANPFVDDYAWGRNVLIDYRCERDRPMQGALTLPANYSPGNKYPMIVYFYDRRSDELHLFSMPVYDDRPHPSTYASNGYLMLRPDIAYETGKPGTSAVDCVTAAARRAIELGYADRERIGLHGHSWGGYESAYIVTQTSMFAAAVAGAPITDYFSLYNTTYPGPIGNPVQRDLEVSWGRMGENVTPWTHRDLWASQSPVLHVDKLETPVLLLHGTEDGTVEWRQSLHYFNAARRNRKPVILLSYRGENHHLTKKENQLDFLVRLRQFFDHHLRGEPAPQWMSEPPG